MLAVSGNLNGHPIGFTVEQQSTRSPDKKSLSYRKEHIRPIISGYSN